MMIDEDMTRRILRKAYEPVSASPEFKECLLRLLRAAYRGITMAKCKEYRMGDRVRIKKHELKPQYVGLHNVGLEGQIIWRGHGSMANLYQIETKTKPPYYRPAYPEGFIVTVHAQEIELIKASEGER